MPSHRGDNGRAVARYARNKGRAADAVPIELRDPAIGQRLGRPRPIPSQLRERRVASERAEEWGREEVTVCVVHVWLTEVTEVTASTRWNEGTEVTEGARDRPAARASRTQEAAENTNRTNDRVCVLQRLLSSARRLAQPAVGRARVFSVFLRCSVPPCRTVVSVHSVDFVP